MTASDTEKGPLQQPEQNGATREARIPKTLYIRQIETRLAQIKERYDGIGDKIDRIDKTKSQVDTCLVTIERNLDQLKQADEESSADLRRSIDSAWDDLARAISNIIARLS